jgi:hypothetical protein
LNNVQISTFASSLLAVNSATVFATRQVLAKEEGLEFNAGKGDVGVDWI